MTRYATEEHVFVPGIMELVERTGIHSGDSISVYPTFSISDNVRDVILDYTKLLGLGIGIVGLYNIQFIVDHNERVYHNRGQSALVKNRSVPVKGDRLQPCRHRHAGHARRQP